MTMSVLGITSKHLIIYKLISIQCYQLEQNDQVLGFPLLKSYFIGIMGQQHTMKCKETNKFVPEKL